MSPCPHCPDSEAEGIALRMGPIPADDFRSRPPFKCADGCPQFQWPDRCRVLNVRVVEVKQCPQPVAGASR